MSMFLLIILAVLNNFEGLSFVCVQGEGDFIDKFLQL